MSHHAKGLALLLAAALAGCSSARINVNTDSRRVSAVPAGTTVSGGRIQLSTDSRVGAAIIIAVLVADGLRYFRLEPDGTRTPVDPRDYAGAASLAGPRVSVQDCSRPIDVEAGNLVCR